MALQRSGVRSPSSPPKFFLKRQADGSAFLIFRADHGGELFARIVFFEFARGEGRNVQQTLQKQPRRRAKTPRLARLLGQFGAPKPLVWCALNFRFRRRETVPRSAQRSSRSERPAPFRIRGEVKYLGGYFNRYFGGGSSPNHRPVSADRSSPFSCRLSAPNL